MPTSTFFFVAFNGICILSEKTSEVSVILETAEEICVFVRNIGEACVIKLISAFTFFFF